MPRESSAEERMTAVAQAHAAFRQLRTSASDERSRWLVGIAEAVEDHRSALVAVADEETTLGAGRLNSELDRTVYRFHHFRNAIAQEKHRRAIDQPGDPEASPQPRPSLKQMRVPLGPVAVWGASNFPFAFGVLGGDTASALASEIVFIDDQPMNIEGARCIGMVCVHLEPTNPEAGFLEARRLLGLEPR